MDNTKYDLGQMFWVSFYKLLTIVCWKFGPFLLTELVELIQVCRPPCSYMPFQLCQQICCCCNKKHELEHELIHLCNLVNVSECEACICLHNLVMALEFFLISPLASSILLSSSFLFPILPLTYLDLNVQRISV